MAGRVELEVLDAFAKRQGFTPLKINMEHFNNGGLENDSSL